MLSDRIKRYVNLKNLIFLLSIVHVRLAVLVLLHRFRRPDWNSWPTLCRSP